MSNRRLLDELRAQLRSERGGTGSRPPSPPMPPRPAVVSAPPPSRPTNAPVRSGGPLSAFFGLIVISLLGFFGYAAWNRVGDYQPAAAPPPTLAGVPTVPQVYKVGLVGVQVYRAPSETGPSIAALEPASEIVSSELWTGPGEKWFKISAPVEGFVDQEGLTFVAYQLADQTFEAGFDCARVATEAEVAICLTEALARIDREHSARYQTLKDRRSYRGGVDNELPEERSQHLTARSGCGSDTQCIERVYSASTETLLRLENQEVYRFSYTDPSTSAAVSARFERQKSSGIDLVAPLKEQTLRMLRFGPEHRIYNFLGSPDSAGDLELWIQPEWSIDSPGFWQRLGALLRAYPEAVVILSLKQTSGSNVASNRERRLAQIQQLASGNLPQGSFVIETMATSADPIMSSPYAERQVDRGTILNLLVRTGQASSAGLPELLNAAEVVETSADEGSILSPPGVAPSLTGSATQRQEHSNSGREDGSICLTDSDILFEKEPTASRKRRATEKWLRNEPRDADVKAPLECTVDSKFKLDCRALESGNFGKAAVQIMNGVRISRRTMRGEPVFSRCLRTAVIFKAEE